MRTLPPSPLARCPVDGVPLVLVVYGGVVMAGCELCDRAVSYAPREMFEPPRRTGKPGAAAVGLTERPRRAFENDPRARAYMRAAAARRSKGTKEPGAN